MNGAPLGDFFSIVPVGVLTIATIASSGKLMKSDLLAQVSVLFVLAGFFAATISAPWAYAASASLLSCGNALFDVVGWVVLAAVGTRNVRASVATIAWGRGVSALGSIVGGNWRMGERGVVDAPCRRAAGNGRARSWVCGICAYWSEELQFHRYHQGRD